MANRYRGEVDAVIDGRPATLVLTLGALAELEAAFGAGDLAALAARFEAGRMSARDVATILAAGLRGAGRGVTAEDVAAMRIEGGAAGAVRLVATLLSATFGTDEQPGADPPVRPRPAREELLPPLAPPFPGPG